MKKQDSSHNTTSSAQTEFNKELNELLKLKFAWFQLQKIALVVSLVGLFFATMIAGTGYLFYKNYLIQMFYLASAMGCLSSSVIGINIMDRLKKQKVVPYVVGVFGLILIIGALLLVFVKSKPYHIPIECPILISVIYSSIMIGILWNLRNLEQNITLKEKELE